MYIQDAQFRPFHHWPLCQGGEVCVWFNELPQPLGDWCLLCQKWAKIAVGEDHADNKCVLGTLSTLQEKFSSLMICWFLVPTPFHDCACQCFLANLGVYLWVFPEHSLWARVHQHVTLPAITNMLNPLACGSLCRSCSLLGSSTLLWPGGLERHVHGVTNTTPWF